MTMRKCNSTLFTSAWAAEFKLILRSYPYVQSLLYGWDDHTSSSQYVERVIDFKEKPHRDLL
jgi:hypothetical protein